MTKRDVQGAIRLLLARRGRLASGDLAELTGLSRQALQRHLARATSAGWLVREGQGRGTSYTAAAADGFDRAYETESLQESRVALELLGWLDEIGCRGTDAAVGVLKYSVSEVVNNAIDHSGAAEVRLRATPEGSELHVSVQDLGIGAFENLRARLQLEDHLHALQELSKGKTTTQPERHSGEGLFFTSKLVERFELVANGLAWIVDNAGGDTAVLEAEGAPGTLVSLVLALDAKRTCLEVFERYTNDFEFDTTRTVVHLFEYGTDFVSRSEAKRLLANLERFRVVILDFKGVRGVGQGFADEVFRVWARRHPEVELIPREMNGPVEFMVRRALRAREELR